GAEVAVQGGGGAVLEFGVLVAAARHPPVELAQAGHAFDAAAKIEAVLAQVDAHIVRVVAVFLVAVPMLVFVLVLVVHVRARRNAVVAAIGAGGGAEPGARAEPAGADGTAAAVQARVRHAAVRQVAGVLAFGQRFGHQRRRPGMAGYAVSGGLTMEASDVQGEGAGLAIEARHRHVLGGAAAVADLATAADGRAGRHGRYAAIHHVHRAADGAAAVEQGGRALEHLDLVGQEGLDGDGVVGADGGDVHGRHAAGQYL